MQRSGCFLGVARNGRAARPSTAAGVCGRTRRLLSWVLLPLLIEAAGASGPCSPACCLAEPAAGVAAWQPCSFARVSPVIRDASHRWSAGTAAAAVPATGPARGSGKAPPARAARLASDCSSAITAVECSRGARLAGWATLVRQGFWSHPGNCTRLLSGKSTDVGRNNWEQSGGHRKDPSPAACWTMLSMLCNTAIPSYFAMPPTGSTPSPLLALRFRDLLSHTVSEYVKPFQAASSLHLPSPPCCPSAAGRQAHPSARPAPQPCTQGLQQPQYASEPLFIALFYCSKESQGIKVCGMPACTRPVAGSTEVRSAACSCCALPWS